MCNKRLEGFQVCHIQLAVVHLPRGGRVLMVARGGYNGGAALGQCLNQGGSDAAAGTGDQGNLAVRSLLIKGHLW